MFAKIYLAVFCACILSSAVLADDVIVGTDKNFESVIKENSFVVAEFYAPWCGHCKQLEPQYSKAAKQLKSHDPPIVLMKVDATEEGNKDLATKYGIQGFPTLKIFRDHDLENPSEYKGPREADGIVSYLKKKTQPPSKLLETKDQVKAFQEEADIVVLGIFDQLSGAEYETFSSVAAKLSDDLSFAHATAKVASGKAPSVKLIKKSEGKEHAYSETYETSKLEAWIEARAVPLLIDLEDQKNRDAVQKAFASSGPRFFSLYEKGSAIEKDLRAALTTLAETLVGETHFINIESSNQQALDFFGLTKEQTPAFVIQSGDSKDKYVLDKITPKQLKGFWKDFKAGKLKKTIKSAEPPADNTKPVTIATGKTLEEIAFSGKTVLLEFYAPWCGHCKKLEPVYEEVGQEFAKDDNIVIAKLDATANDVTSAKFEVQGFPSLYLVNKSGDVVQYQGDRSAADLIKFVKTNAGTSTIGSAEDHSEL